MDTVNVVNIGGKYFCFCNFSLPFMMWMTFEVVAIYGILDSLGDTLMS